MIVFKDSARYTVELWRFDTKVVAEMATKVFEASGGNGQQWLPLDDTRDMGVQSMVAGSLLKRGELVASEPVEWIDDEATPDDNNPSPVQEGLAPLTLAQAREGLAKYHRVEPQKSG